VASLNRAAGRRVLLLRIEMKPKARRRRERRTAGRRSWVRLDSARGAFDAGIDRVVAYLQSGPGGLPNSACASSTVRDGFVPGLATRRSRTALRIVGIAQTAHDLASCGSRLGRRCAIRAEPNRVSTLDRARRCRASCVRWRCSNEPHAKPAPRRQSNMPANAKLAPGAWTLSPTRITRRR